MNTVLFDMDGVIIDSEPVYLVLINKIYDEIGAPVPEDVHLSSLGVNSLDWWTFIINEYNVKGYSPQELSQKEQEGIINYMTDPEIEKDYFPGLAEVLKELKNRGFKIGIASASGYNVIESVLKLGNIREYFDVIVSAADPAVKNGKPEPDVFLYTALKLGAQPEECLVIEDSELGLQAAKKANMKAAAFRSAPKPIDTSMADFVFDKYDEFFDLIELD